MEKPGGLGGDQNTGGCADQAGAPLQDFPNHRKGLKGTGSMGWEDESQGPARFISAQVLPFAFLGVCSDTKHLLLLPQASFPSPPPPGGELTFQRGLSGGLVGNGT